MPSFTLFAAALALVFNAFVWGVSWWPLRQLDSAGVHPLWTTAIVYALAVAAISALRPRAWLQLARTPALWTLVLAAGTTNAAFNWGVTVGDVVRVVLLFYLMPLWAVLLAWWLLDERPTRVVLLRVALALAGALVVLWPEGTTSLPLPRDAADMLGLAGGASFALNNVMLRRLRQQPEAARALAMFAGGVLVAAAAALLLVSRGAIGWPPVPQAEGATAWRAAAALALGALFLAGNLALQYGAARLPANATAVIMLTEVLFASGSAVMLGGGTLTPRLALGGALIVLATLLVARRPVLAGPAPG